MTEVTESAVMKVKSNRGRAPVVLKGGKLLSEARAEAKAAVKTAKTELKNLKAALAAAIKTVNANAKDVDKAKNALTKVETNTKLSPADRKAALASAKADVKAAEAALKISTKAREAAAKATAKGTATVEKAVAAQLKVEAAKLGTIN